MADLRIEAARTDVWWTSHRRPDCVHITIPKSYRTISSHVYERTGRLIGWSRA